MAGVGLGVDAKGVGDEVGLGMGLGGVGVAMGRCEVGDIGLVELEACLCRRVGSGAGVGSVCAESPGSGGTQRVCIATRARARRKGVDHGGTGSPIPRLVPLV